MKTPAFILAILFVLQGPFCVFAEMASADSSVPADQTAHDCCADSEDPASPPLAPAPGEDTGPGHCDIHCMTLSQMIGAPDATPDDLSGPAADVPLASDLSPLSSTYRPISIRANGSSELNSLGQKNSPLLI